MRGERLRLWTTYAAEWLLCSAAADFVGVVSADVLHDLRGRQGLTVLPREKQR